MASVTDLYRYEIVSKDSEGKEPRPVAEHGMGVIYKAYDLLLDEIVALKVVRSEILTKQPKKAKRSFLAEAMAGARLGKQCPHIVKVLDIGQLEDILYMAQEWVPGGNIVRLCGKVTLFTAKSIILQIGNAVQIAHRNGIVHSDIAPANILFDSRRNIYRLSDFGLLKLMDKTSISISGSSTFMTGGRRDFMPKEHFDDPGQINYSTDVYALAVTFYVLLTGELPPKGRDGRPDREKMPGTIEVKGEGGRKVSKVIPLLDEFIFRHKDTHRIERFLQSLSQLPV
ncbi:serine/threonine protein kinase [Candidatus Parcubacteria bacterium]|nr:MAG: serine/threonine protein kinase [Candidatus Parcubacteria bacterium]